MDADTDQYGKCGAHTVTNTEHVEHTLSALYKINTTATYCSHQEGPPGVASALITISHHIVGCAIKLQHAQDVRCTRAAHGQPMATSCK